MASLHNISPCLWYESEAEEAAKFYVSMFDDSSLGTITRYGKEGLEIHGRPEGAVMSVAFHLEGHAFTAFNGGAPFEVSKSISLQVFCNTQEEINRFWDNLGEGGEYGPSGWLKDKFGLSWQVVPSHLSEMIGDPDNTKSERVIKAMLGMKRLEIAALERAYNGL